MPNATGERKGDTAKASGRGATKAVNDVTQTAARGKLHKRERGSNVGRVEAEKE